MLLLLLTLFGEGANGGAEPEPSTATVGGRPRRRPRLLES